MFTNNSFLCFTKNRFIITYHSSRLTTPSILCPCLSLCKSIQQHYFHALFEILSRFSPFRLADILNWATIHFYSMTLNDTTNHYTNTKAKSWNSLSIGGNSCLFHDYLVFKNHSFIFFIVIEPSSLSSPWTSSQCKLGTRRLQWWLFFCSFGIPLWLYALFLFFSKISLI